MLKKIAFASLLLAGCASEIDDPEAAESTVAITMPAGDAAQVLALVNYPGTDLAVLDQQVGLDARAAQNIIAERNGADGVAPSADDVLFADLGALDAVPYVGDTAFTKLRTWAVAHPVPSAESVESVSFQGWEAEAVIWGVNHATVQELDIDAALDGRAANNLIAARPFTTVTAMGPVAYVGTSALSALRARASIWWATMHAPTAPAGGGTFDGVSFDEATVTVALQIANQATKEQLVAHGMYSTGATKMVAARPYDGLAAVAAVDGIGTATMQALKTFAQSGDWTTPTFILDAANVAGVTQLIKEGLWDDEGFAHDVLDLVGGNEDLYVTVMNALEGEIDRVAGTLLGTSYADEEAAREGVADAANVKGNTRALGWTYLESLGVSH